MIEAFLSPYLENLFANNFFLEEKNYAGNSNCLFILKVHMRVTRERGNATKRIDMCHMGWCWH